MCPASCCRFDPVRVGEPFVADAFIVDYVRVFDEVSSERRQHAGAFCFPAAVGRNGKFVVY